MDRKAFVHDVPVKFIALFLTVSLVLALSFFSGCGGKREEALRNSLVEFTIDNVILAQRRQAKLLVVWMRFPVEDTEVARESVYERIWKIEDGGRTEIGSDEFEMLKTAREGEEQKWVYSQHSVTILSLDAVKGEATVEVWSFYSSRAGEAVRYQMKYGGGGWQLVEEQAIWKS